MRQFFGGMHSTARVGALVLFAVLAKTSLQSYAGAAPALTKADIVQMLKSLSNWGRWGKEDQLGALNLITPRKRKEAAALVREGISISLAHDVVKTKLFNSPPF